jgi:hypothetical protein
MLDNIPRFRESRLIKGFVTDENEAREEPYFIDT